MPSKSARNRILIIYNSADKKWLARLKIHLRPLEQREQNIIEWNTRLRNGNKWHTGIHKALASAKVAILLVSADLLASDLIHNDQLPPLLRDASKKGLIIIPVIVGHCAFSFSQLAYYQSVNDPDRPLSSISEGQVDEILFTLFQYISSIFSKDFVPVKKNLALKALRVENFKGIRRIEINNLPESAKWIVLTGENGFGKTSVLQAIAAGLYGNYFQDESGLRLQLVPDLAYVEVEYFSAKKTLENNSRYPRELSELVELDRELATYGSSRLQISANVTTETIERQIPSFYSLFNTDGVLLNIEQRLKDAFTEEVLSKDEQRVNDRSLFGQIVDVFRKLLPQLKDIKIQEVNQFLEVRYIEQDENSNALSEGASFTQLAAGLKNVIALVGDMIYRLSTRQDVDQLADLQGIVIIDEFELHLHPKYQKWLPEKLSELFPHIQFIISTHSPIPLLGVPPDTVILHVTRDVEKGIQVERLDVDFTTLTPNAILTSPIFGFDDIIPLANTTVADVATEDTYSEAERTKRLKEKLKVLKAKLNED